MNRIFVAACLILLGPVSAQEIRLIDFDDAPDGLVSGNQFRAQGVTFSTVRILDAPVQPGQEVDVTHVSDQVLIKSSNPISPPRMLLNGSDSTDDILCSFTAPVRFVRCDLDSFKGAGEFGDIVRLIGLRRKAETFVVVATDEEEDGADKLGIEAADDGPLPMPFYNAPPSVKDSIILSSSSLASMFPHLCLCR